MSDPAVAATTREWESQFARISQDDYDSAVGAGETPAHAAQFALSTYQSMLGASGRGGEYVAALAAFDADGAQFVGEMFAQLDYGTDQWQVWAPAEEWEAWFAAHETAEAARLDDDAKVWGFESWAALAAQSDENDKREAEFWGVVTEAAPVVSETERKSALFVDLDELDSFDPPRASLVQRADGAFLLYRGAVNGLVGDPEQGKSLVAVAMALEAARADLTTVWLDLDHNGPVAFRSRLMALGWDKADGFDRFRFAQPEDRDGVKDVIKWAVEQAHAGVVGLVVIDSLGELLPMFGASSDSSDDYTRVNREVTVPAALAGAAVLTIDHLAKGSESRAYGSTGTMAKKRAIDGAYYRVTAIKAFAPGHGGKASLKVLKDRHGSLRNSTVDGSGKEPEAAIWELEANGEWTFTKPGVRTNPVLLDVTRLAFTTPPFTSQNQVRKAFGWGAERTRKAWEEWTR